MRVLRIIGACDVDGEAVGVRLGEGAAAYDAPVRSIVPDCCCTVLPTSLITRLCAAFGSNGRLGGHAGASLRKTGLAVAINEMLKRRSVAEWLRRGPVADCEIRVADEEQFDLRARLVEPAELRKACRQETA